MCFAVTTSTLQSPGCFTFHISLPRETISQTDKLHRTLKNPIYRISGIITCMQRFDYIQDRLVWSFRRCHTISWDAHEHLMEAFVSIHVLTSETTTKLPSQNPRSCHSILVISPWTKWPSFHRRYFQMPFHLWKILYFDWNFTELCS